MAKILILFAVSKNIDIVDNVCSEETLGGAGQPFSTSPPPPSGEDDETNKLEAKKKVKVKKHHHPHHANVLPQTGICLALCSAERVINPY